MQIEYLDINEVIPYDNNPRNNDGEAVDRVAASIKEYGFKVPIIIDKDNVIVTGHTRLKAAKKLELKKVPIIRANDLTPEQIKAYRIADIRIAEYATWNNELLTMELSELQDLDFDLDLTAFQEWELENLLNPVSDEDLQDFFVDKEEKPKEPKMITCPHCGESFEK